MAPTVNAGGHSFCGSALAHNALQGNFNVRGDTNAELGLSEGSEKALILANVCRLGTERNRRYYHKEQRKLLQVLESDYESGRNFVDKQHRRHMRAVFHKRKAEEMARQ